MAVSEAQKKATAKYEKEKYDKILTRFPKNTKDKIKETGASSVNNFIVMAVKNELEKYESKEEHEIILPAGTIEKYKRLGILNIEEYINKLVSKDLEQREKPHETPTAAVSEEMTEETKSRIYKDITGADMPDWMRHEQDKIQVVQPEKSPDSVIFEGLEVSPERAKEIQDKLDQQFKAKEEQEKQTPKRDSFIATLERLKKDNQDGKLALNVREDI